MHVLTDQQVMDALVGRLSPEEAVVMACRTSPIVLWARDRGIDLRFPEQYRAQADALLQSHACDSANAVARHSRRLLRSGPAAASPEDCSERRALKREALEAVAVTSRRRVPRMTKG